MTVLLVFGLFIVIATAHNITLLEVPPYGDPRKEAELTCHFVSEKGDPPLHSVKLYRDINEIFRYTPGQNPETRTFNNTAGGVTRGSCHPNSCTIRVMLPKKINTRISFTCEVSTEGPRFAVVKDTKYLTVAVPLSENPTISGVPGSVQLGEDIQVNCTTKPAVPPANIVWYIDGKPEMVEPWTIENTMVFAPDGYGLRASMRTLKLRVSTPRNFISLRCEAIQPTKPPFTRSTNTTISVAKSPHLSMFTASGTCRLETAVWAFLACTSLHIIFLKYSALSEN